jgi:hypothetical protein
MTHKSVEYVGVESSGVRLVSAKQVTVFPTGTTFGILFYALVHGTSVLIETPPIFQFSATVGSPNQAQTATTQKVPPSQRDYPFFSKVTLPDGTEQTIPKSLDQAGIYPVIDMEGYIYFQVAVTDGQKILGAKVELVG